MRYLVKVSYMDEITANSFEEVLKKLGTEGARIEIANDTNRYVCSTHLNGRIKKIEIDVIKD